MELEKRYDGISLYSGGTDSVLATILASQQIGKNILCLTANLGMSSFDFEKARERAHFLGFDHLVIDGAQEFARDYLSEAVQMNASYEGYPCGTPMGRAFAVMKAVEILKQNGETRETYVVHGCTRRQNTRIRIEDLVAEHNIRGLGPLTEKVYTREDKIELLRRYGVQVVSRDSFATDENIYCRAVESVDFNSLGEINESEIFRWVKDIESTPDVPSIHQLKFENGLPVQLDGKGLRLDEIIVALNTVGANNGVGRIMVIEDTIPVFSEKIRDFYEAPGSEMIRYAHKLIEAVVLPKYKRDRKEAMDKRWAELVYGGKWFSGEARDIAEEGKRTQEKVRGDVKIKVFKGHITMVEAEIPHSLLLQRSRNQGTY